MKKWALVHHVPGTFAEYLFEIESDENGARPSLYDSFNDAVAGAVDHLESTLEAGMEITLFVPVEVEVDDQCGQIALNIDGLSIHDLHDFCVKGGQI